MEIAHILLAFAIMLGLLLLGMPIAVIMVLLGAVGGAMAFGWPLIDSIGSVVWGVANENILTAIPLFILLGELLLRSGIAVFLSVDLAGTSAGRLATYQYWL